MLQNKMLHRWTEVSMLNCPIVWTCFYLCVSKGICGFSVFVISTAGNIFSLRSSDSKHGHLQHVAFMIFFLMVSTAVVLVWLPVSRVPHVTLFMLTME